jgi:Uma2 family endonuclease
MIASLTWLMVKSIVTPGLGLPTAQRRAASIDGWQTRIGWLFLFEPELRLGKDLVVPDIAGWRRERMPRAPDVAQISLAPDWICEVLSNGTEAFDRGPKRRCYVRAGVPHLWCVQPAAKLIEVFRKPGDFYATVAAEVFTESISLEPFTAVPIDLSELVQWADDQPEA